MTETIIGAMAIGWTSVPVRKAITAGIVVLLAVEVPFLLLPATLGAVLVTAVSRVRSSRGRQIQNQADLAALCDLTAIGLTGGLGIQPALEIAISHVGDEMAGDVRSVLRRARVDGMGVVMLNADGIGQRLYRAVGQASATGAPLIGAVSHLADDLHADLAANRLRAVRRLPVTLLFPLTLLILPGFLLLTIAPAILDAFARLEM